MVANFTATLHIEQVWTVKSSSAAKEESVFCILRKIQPIFYAYHTPCGR